MAMAFTQGLLAEDHLFVTAQVVEVVVVEHIEDVVAAVVLLELRVEQVPVLEARA